MAKTHFWGNFFSKSCRRHMFFCRRPYEKTCGDGNFPKVHMKFSCDDDKIPKVYMKTTCGKDKFCRHPYEKTCGDDKIFGKKHMDVDNFWKKIPQKMGLRHMKNI